MGVGLIPMLSIAMGMVDTEEAPHSPSVTPSTAEGSGRKSKPSTVPIEIPLSDLNNLRFLTWAFELDLYGAFGGHVFCFERFGVNPRRFVGAKGTKVLLYLAFYDILQVIDMFWSRPMQRMQNV